MESVTPEPSQQALPPTSPPQPMRRLTGSSGDEKSSNNLNNTNPSEREKRRASIREAITEGLERQTMVSGDMIESYLKNIGNNAGGSGEHDVNNGTSGDGADGVQLREELVLENQSLRVQFEKVININLALSRALNEANVPTPPFSHFYRDIFARIALLHRCGNRPFLLIL